MSTPKDLAPSGQCKSTPSNYSSFLESFQHFCHDLVDMTFESAQQRQLTKAVLPKANLPVADTFHTQNNNASSQETIDEEIITKHKTSSPNPMVHSTQANEVQEDHVWPNGALQFDKFFQL
jgi:hypothetical protein